MTSEIRTNSLTSRAGLSTVTLTDSGPMFSGITTFVDNSGFTFGVGGGTSIFTPATNVLTFGTNNTEKIRIDASGHMHGVGVITATHFYGDGSNLTGITGTTINNNADNRVITGSGTANTLNGESSLTYDGTNLQLTTDANNEGIKIDGGVTYPVFEMDANRGAGNTLGKLVQKWNGTQVASISFVSGTDTSNKDDGIMYFNTASSGTPLERLRITSSGALGTNSTVRSANGGLDLCSQGATNLGTLTLGAGGGQNGQSRNNNQENQFRIMSPTYANPSNMFTVMYGASGSSEHEINYGGGTGWAYAANKHRFFTAANQTTGTGTERLHIASNGSVGVNIGNPQSYDPGARALVVGEVDGYGHTGLTIRSNGTDKQGAIYFADGTGSASYRGRIEYHHSDDSLNFGAAGNGGVFQLTSNKSLRSGNLAINGLTVNDTFYSNLQSDNHANTLFGLNLGLVRSGSGTGSGTHEVQQLNSHGSIGACGILMGGNGSNNNTAITFFAFGQGNSAGHNFGQDAWKVRIKRTGDVMEVKTTQNSGNAGMIVFRDGNNDYCGQITSNGSSNTSNFVNNSDYRLKTNVSSITDGITRVKNLKPYQFEWKSDLGTKVDGFFAHEAQTVVPESVVGTKDEVDSDGKPKYQGIDQAKLVPVLTASIKELIAKVESLEEQNIALRVRVTNLEGN